MEQDVKAIVAKNLTELRKERGLTQTALAKTINYSDKAVSKWECGESLPDLNVLCQLAEFYGVTIDYLVTADEDEKAKLVKRKPRSEIPLQNKILITCLIFASMFLIATVIFVYAMHYGKVDRAWRVFVWAVPFSCLFTLAFLRKWRAPSWMTFTASSVLCWSAITCAYLQFFTYSFWYIFIIGVPIQIILLLSSQLIRAPKQ